MCGISGIVSKNLDVDELLAMQAAIRHRGPDNSSYSLLSQAQCGLSHNRLKILDLKTRANQPIESSCGRFTMVYNGEVYNYKELRAQLPDYRFKTTSDTEVILQTYKQKGVSALNDFNGMFAIAIWDQDEKSLTLARDRFGVKPLYYFQDEEGFYFSSEIKSFFHAGKRLSPDEKTWARYLNFGLYDHDENTFWKNVKKLLPGHYLKLKDGKVTVTRWYHFSNDNRSKRQEEVLLEYDALLRESIRQCTVADVPIGTALSSGLDSSLLAAQISQFSENGHSKSFSFGFSDFSGNELEGAVQTAESLNLNHQSVLLTPDEVPDLFSKMQRFQDEPFGGLPTLAYSKLFKAARDNGRYVILDGQGLDEQWAGYSYYLNANNTSQSKELKLIPEIQGSQHQPLPSEFLLSEIIKLALIESIESPYDTQLQNLQYRDLFYTKIPRSLRFNDRSSMMHGVELRVPFLDHRLVELSFLVDDEFKIKNKLQKVFLREYFSKNYPRVDLKEKKQAVQSPQTDWLRGPLAGWAEERIEFAISKHDGWLNPGGVRDVWNKFKAGAYDSSFFVWQWISLAEMTDLHS